MSSHATPVEPTAATRAPGWLARWRRLLGDRRGAVAIYFVLTLIPLAVATGAAIDISRAYLVKQRLCYALDAAGLAVGSATGTQEQLNAVLQSFFTANYPTGEIGTPTTPVLLQNGNVLTVSAEATVETTLMKVVGVNSTTVGCYAEITKSSKSVEVAMVLDVTNSMSGQPIADLKLAAKDLVDIVIQDVQTPFYSKVAMVPYSNSINAGTYASQVRGTITPGKTITNVQWFKAAAKNITAASKTNPVVVTSAGHGFVTGDFIRITGVNGMTQLNNNNSSNLNYRVGTTTANTFQVLQANNTNLNGTGFNSYTNSGTVRPCNVQSCAPVVTATSHGFATNNRVRITDVAGPTQINDVTHQVTNLTANTFSIPVNPFNPALADYTSGGNAWCTLQGCEFLFFTNPSGNTRTHRVSTCVTERAGGDAFTDAAPSTTLLGRNYPVSGNPCPTPVIVPLTATKSTLNDAIDTLTAGSSTGGHIGVGWGWYMLAPNFGYLWPASSVPAAYNAANTIKVVVLMTDGEYNSVYCNGVISQDSTSGSGASNDHINCNAPNGGSYTQSGTLCTNMKAQGIVVYTVGFNVLNTPNAQNLIQNCATDSAHVYLPVTGSELKDAFKSIAQSISNLRLSR
jgi:Flp pilus assembly protein TadG